MPLAGIIGGIIGVLAALGGVFMALYSTGVFEYLGGRKKLAIAPIDKEKLRLQIAQINSSDLPYQIDPSDKTDFELVWKIADARWQGIFARERLSKTYRACIYLDDSRHTVRVWQALDNVEWVAGAPKVHFQKEFFRGKIIYQKSYGVQYGVKDDKTFGKVYEYNFDIGQIIGPIRQAALDGGWEFIEVLQKKNAMKPLKPA
jgi:hypothetical protein